MFVSIKCLDKMFWNKCLSCSYRSFSISLKCKSGNKLVAVTTALEVHLVKGTDWEVK